MISRRPTNRNLQIFTAPTKAKSQDTFAFSRLISPRGESYADPASPLVPLTSLTLKTDCSCARLRALPVSGPDIGPRLNVKTCMHNFPEVRDGGDIFPCPPPLATRLSTYILYERRFTSSDVSNTFYCIKDFKVQNMFNSNQKLHCCQTYKRLLIHVRHKINIESQE